MSRFVTPRHKLQVFCPSAFGKEDKSEVLRVYCEAAFRKLVEIPIHVPVTGSPSNYELNDARLAMITDLIAVSHFFSR